MFIPGWLIAIVTFPGVIAHEMGHKFFCDLFKVKVHEVRYFRFGNPAGYVVHDVSPKFYQMFFIDVGPFIVNTLVTLFIFYILAVSNIGGIASTILLWLGFSIGMHAFPSSHDAKVMWSESKKHLKKGNLAALIGFPISVLIRIANLLSIIWFDLIYAIALYLMVVSLFPSLYPTFISLQSSPEEKPLVYESKECGFSIKTTSKWTVKSNEEVCYFTFVGGENFGIIVNVRDEDFYESLQDYIEFSKAIGAFTFAQDGSKLENKGIFTEYASGRIHNEAGSANAEIFAMKKNGKYYIVTYIFEHGNSDEMDKIYSFKVFPTNSSKRNVSTAIETTSSESQTPESSTGYAVETMPSESPSSTGVWTTSSEVGTTSQEITPTTVPMSEPI